MDERGRASQEFVAAVRLAEAHVERQRPARRAHQEELLETLMLRAQGPSLARHVRALWWGGGGLALATAAAALMLWWPASTSAPPSPARTHTAQGLTSTCALPEHAGSISVRQGCTITWLSGHAELAAKEEALVGRRGEALVLERGEVTVDIDPLRPAPRMVRVRVSGGVIEVLGTRFTIKEEGTRGQVTLHRGSIRFIPPQGSGQTLEPGQTRTWGERVERAALPTPAPPPVEKVKPSPPKTQPKTRPRRGSVSASELEMLRELRRLKRYEDALSNLKRLSRRNLDKTTREVLSFERGELLELRGDDACGHWRRHQRRWRRGTYRAAVRGRLKGCTR